MSDISNSICNMGDSFWASLEPLYVKVIGLCSLQRVTVLPPGQC